MFYLVFQALTCVLGAIFEGNLQVFTLAKIVWLAFFVVHGVPGHVKSEFMHLVGGLERILASNAQSNIGEVFLEKVPQKHELGRL